MEKRKIVRFFTDQVLGDAYTPDLPRVERFTWLMLGILGVLVVAELTGAL